MMIFAYSWDWFKRFEFFFSRIQLSISSFNCVARKQTNQINIQRHKSIIYQERADRQ